MLTQICYDVLFDITYYLARIKTDKIKIKKRNIIITTLIYYVKLNFNSKNI